MTEHAQSIDLPMPSRRPQDEPPARLEPGVVDWPALVDGLNAVIRLRTSPTAMKLFATVAEMEALSLIHI